MKFEVNKKELVNLTRDTQIIPNALTNNVAGGVHTDSANCPGWISVAREPGMTEPDDYCNNVLLP